MDASTVTLAVAGLAVLVGIVVAVDLVRTRPRNAARARHPSTTPPLTITVARSNDGSHWRVDLPVTRATTSVDIVTYRPIGSSAEWESEPIVEPIELHPGGWALLPSVVSDPGIPHELVVGWTVHGAGADVTGSGRFVVDDAHGAVTAPAEMSDRTWLVAGVVAIALLVVAGGLVVRELVRTGDDDVNATAPTVATEPSLATTQVPSSPAAPTTTSVASMAPTIPPSPVVPTDSAVDRSDATSTTTATTSTSPPTSTTSPDDPAVVIVGRVEDCRFGPQCLIAGFTIERFDGRPQEYLCEFSDGSTVTFSFGGTGVETACSQTGPSPAITIEVDGVRSETITRDSVTADASAGA